MRKLHLTPKRVILGIAALAITYTVTLSPYIVLLLIVDFYIRAFTSLKYSPLSWIAAQINQLFKLPVIMTDKAKKIFSARVGFLFAVAIFLTYFLNPLISVFLSLVLVTFALLESLLNICVGCLVYTYFVFPYFRPKSNEA